jgi:hypothetical protein
MPHAPCALRSAHLLTFSPSQLLSFPLSISPHLNQILIGAAKVLCETFEMIMAEIVESGGLELSAEIAAHNTTS